MEDFCPFFSYHSFQFILRCRNAVNVYLLVNIARVHLELDIISRIYIVWLCWWRYNHVFLNRFRGKPRRSNACLSSATNTRHWQTQYEEITLQKSVKRRCTHPTSVLRLQRFVACIQHTVPLHRGWLFPACVPKLIKYNIRKIANAPSKFTDLFWRKYNLRYNTS